MKKTEFQKQKLAELVRRFKTNIDRYKKPTYDETSVRSEFIDEFFACFGWDITNEAGVLDEFKDVEREYYVKSRTGIKRPDYAFKMGGIAQFFVEAKKPSENIKETSKHALQLKKYAFNKKMPLSILTDFEELAVYDCQRRPRDGEDAKIGRILYYRYEDYVEKFDEVWDLFSKEAISRGSVENYAKSKRKGAEAVNETFLNDMKAWRTLLAKEVFSTNNRLTVHELNFCIQKLMDRLIFLRICEDRGIEPLGRLLQATKNTGIYKKLDVLFEDADAKYNSGLFDSEISNITKTIRIRDNVLKHIITQLYPPESPYDFSILSVEILGQAYEEFLGQTIRISGKRVIIEDKPEVRAAGGVFYTPDFVVQYIIKNTVKRAIEGKSPEQIERLRIIDPACGSGTFLVCAYDALLEYHLEYYIKKYRIELDKAGNTKSKTVKPKGLAPREIYEIKNGKWRLTSGVRKKILLNNIHGIDVDSYAVEITKMSLLLKVLEHESDEMISKQLKLFSEKALPDLEKNILCGNTLVDYSVNHRHRLSDEDIKRLRPFEWHDTNHKFGEIIEKQGGFDIVIGNPPYVSVQTLDDVQRKYLQQRYETPSKTYDLYYLFVEAGINLLSKTGQLCFILPHKFFTGKSGRELRCFVSSRSSLRDVVHFGTNQVFEKAVTYTCIMTLSCRKDQKFNYGRFKLGENIRNFADLKRVKLSNSTLGCKDWNFSSDAASRIVEKIRRQDDGFGDITEGIFKGSSTGDDKIFVLEKMKDLTRRIALVRSTKNNSEFQIESELLRPFVHGEDVREFVPNQTRKVLLFPYKRVSIDTLDGIEQKKWEIIPEKSLKSSYPLAAKYLESHKKDLKKRASHSGRKAPAFYSYSAARNLSSYDQQKIMVPDMLVSNRIAIDSDGGLYHNANVHGAVFNGKMGDNSIDFYLGILNSNLFWFFIKEIGTAIRGDAYRLTPQFLRQFAFPRVLGENRKDHDMVVDNTKQIKSLITKAGDQTLDADKKLIEAELWRLRHENNIIAYRMYGIRPIEIQVIESKSKAPFGC